MSLPIGAGPRRPSSKGDWARGRRHRRCAEGAGAGRAGGRGGAGDVGTAHRGVGPEGPLGVTRPVGRWPGVVRAGRRGHGRAPGDPGAVGDRRRAGRRRGVGPAGPGTVAVATEARGEATLRRCRLGGRRRRGGRRGLVGHAAVAPTRGQGAGVGHRGGHLARVVAGQPTGTLVLAQRGAGMSGWAGASGSVRTVERRGASSRRAAAAGTAAGRDRSESVTSTTPSSTRSRTARDTPNSVSPRAVASSPTVRPEDTAASDCQLSAVMVTSSADRSPASVTSCSSDGTTASSSFHSPRRALARRSSASMSSGLPPAGGLSSPSKAKLPDSNRSSSNTTSSTGVPSSVRSASASTTPPSDSHTLPRPRSPSIRSRPVFDVVASRRRTSGRANVSRVPCNANAVPPEWIVPPCSPAFVHIRLGRPSPAAQRRADHDAERRR